MFTEGLDPHALRWVREGNPSIINQRRRIDPLVGVRSAGRGLGIPPREKFRTGGVIPVSHTLPVDDDSESVSDMDESSDTEVYGGRYSLNSSPQDDTPRQRIPNGNSTASTATVSRHSYNSSEANSDFSSTGYTVRQQQKQQQQRKNGLVNEYREEEEGELSSSGGSSEFADEVGRTNGGVGALSREAYPAKSYSHNVHLQEDMKDTAKDHHSGIPSAPPFHGDQEVFRGIDQKPFSSSCGITACAVDSNGSPVKIEASSTANAESDITGQYDRCIPVGVHTAPPSGLLPLRRPTFHASGQGPWHSVMAYDACVRLCLHSWARGCMEAPIFLENECALLRTSFGLQHLLLQSEEELLVKGSLEPLSEGVAPKPKKTIGKMKVQARKVRMTLDMPSGCSFSSLKPSSLQIQSLQCRMSNLKSTLSSGWGSLRAVRVLPRLPTDNSFSRHSLSYVHAGAQYIKQVSGLLKVGVTTLRNSSSYDIVQETYLCHIRLKSLNDKDGVRVQPGSAETHVFFPDSIGDDLIVEICDSKGKICGRVVAQLASIVEDSNDKLRWWSIYREPEHELVGRIQLYINYTTSTDENSSLKCGPVAETVAYDIVLETAMKVQSFQQRNLLLHGSWKWLLTEFASYYGVSDAYTRLRYLSYVMDVATPTTGCLTLVHDLLLPVILRSNTKNILSHQENRILGEVVEQLKQILALVFENYKSLDDSSPSGIVEVFTPGNGFPAPALVPAVKLFSLLYDILLPEAQLKLCGYFQAAAKKRLRRHLLDTDEFVAGNTEVNLVDVLTLSTAYHKMKSLCFNIRNEISTDIEIHNQHVLPSFIDLPNIAASIYSVELSTRLHAFLLAFPPPSPSPPVVDLVISTADFQKDLASWNICPVKGGVDAKELFHLYIILWIQDSRLALLESCKLDKVKWSGVRTPQLATPFVDDMYDRLKDTLNEYESIMCRWPEYTFSLENAVADIEKAVVEALEKQYADVLTPLKDAMTPKKFGLKYVQKFTKRHSMCSYIVPDELGILLNTMKRLLDVLRPKIEMQLKSWTSCIPNNESGVAGERLSEVTVMLRAKFRNYLQAVVEKLSENTRTQGATKLKKIIQESKDVAMESDLRSRIQPLKDHLILTINQLHTILEGHVFVLVCRGYWERMGKDVLNFLEDRKENRSWYRGARVAVSILDDTFASQMQQVLGNNAVQEKDLEPPRSIVEVRSILCKDPPILKGSNFYY